MPTEGAAQRQQPPPPRTNGRAIAGLVIGIVAVVAPGLGLPCGIIGLICSLSALSEIRKHSTEQRGEGLAIAGVATSSVAIVLSLMALMFFAVWATLLTAILKSLPHAFPFAPLPGP